MTVQSTRALQTQRIALRKALFDLKKCAQSLDDCRASNKTTTFDVNMAEQRYEAAQKYAAEVLRQTKRVPREHT